MQRKDKYNSLFISIFSIYSLYMNIFCAFTKIKIIN